MGYRHTVHTVDVDDKVRAQMSILINDKVLSLIVEQGPVDVYLSVVWYWGVDFKTVLKRR